jgi:hypothetical protein
MVWNEVEVMRAGNPVLINGVLYPSQTQAAAAIGVHRSRITQALATGRMDGLGKGAGYKVGSGSRKPCRINGKRYPSRVAAARALGVTPSAITQRLQKLAAMDW